MKYEISITHDVITITHYVIKFSDNKIDLMVPNNGLGRELLSNWIKIKAIDEQLDKNKKAVDENV